LTNFDDVFENHSKAIQFYLYGIFFLTLLYYATRVILRYHLGTYLYTPTYKAENKTRQGSCDFSVRVTEHHVVENLRDSSNNYDGNVITFVENFTHAPGGY